MDADSLYRFHHHLVRDTVYGGLLKRARATLHVDFVRWADKVNAERGRGLEFEEILGYHLEQAHHYLAELGPLDEKGREIGADARGGSPRVGGPACVRARRRATPRATCCAAPSRCCRRTIRPRLPLLPELGEVLLELGKFAEAQGARRRSAREAPEGNGNRRVGRRASWCACSCACTAANPAAGARRTLELTTEDDTAARAAKERTRELAKAWRLVAMVQQIAGRIGEAPANDRQGRRACPRWPATSGWWREVRSA